MSDQTAPPREYSRLSRVLGTPVGDLLHGRITGPLWSRPRALRTHRGLVLTAALPVPLADLVLDVTRRTRLRQSEKIDVARELIAHFRDGLEARAAADALSEAFGNPAQAARLIRRAKKRNRSLLWHAWANTWKTIGAVLLAGALGYGLLAIRFYTGHPTIRRNFMAELNAPALALPQSDRAWPLYRQAYLSLPAPPQEILASGRWPSIEPTEAEWPVMEAYVDSMQGSIALLHQAAALPHMGVLLSDTMDPDLLAQSVRMHGQEPPPLAPQPASSDNPPMLGIMLPHLGFARELARDLAADSRVALFRSDGARFEADVSALLGLARHAGEHPFLVSRLVGIAIAALDTDLMGKALDEQPALLTTAQLVGLAHRFAATPAEIDPGIETAFFEDFVQRMYTDDGTGDGRLVAAPDAAAYLPDDEMRPLRRGLGEPVASVLAAGRRDLVSEWRRLIGEISAQSKLPMWTWTERPGVRAVSEAERRPLYKLRYFLIPYLMPALGNVAEQSNNAAMRRDGITAAIALELWRRSHGAYPSTLAELTPDYLPAVPLDQFDGRPLKYTANGTTAVLYSVGRDGDDDGGIPPAGPSGITHAMKWAPPDQVRRDLSDPARRALVDGDWVLWPPVRYDSAGNLIPRP